MQYFGVAVSIGYGIGPLLASVLTRICSSAGLAGNVLNTNNCEISVCETRIKGRLIIFSAIDNLVKGASGQAVQNMNLLFKFPETLGLK